MITRNDIINFCLDNGGCLDEENLEIRFLDFIYDYDGLQLMTRKYNGLQYIYKTFYRATDDTLEDLLNIIKLLIKQPVKQNGRSTEKRE